MAIQNPKASLLSDASKRLVKALEHVDISDDAIAVEVLLILI